MTNHPSTTTPVDPTRLAIESAVRRYSANVVAKTLGVGRQTLVSWLARTATRTTDDSVRARAPRLAALDA